MRRQQLPAGIATAAYLVASALNPALSDNAIFCHLSGEQGHAKMLEYLNVRPILDSYLDGPAMTESQMKECFARSGELIDDLAVTGCNIVGFGDMGIGNSLSMVTP